MAGTITINGSNYTLNTQSLSDEIILNYNENVIAPNPFSTVPNTTLTSGGHNRERIIMSGFCSANERSVFRNAMLNWTKCYLSIIPYGAVDSITLATDYYYIVKLSGEFNKGDNRDTVSPYEYNMELIWGGSDL